MTTVPEHLERFLGTIEAGWSKNADGVRMPFQVVRLPGPRTRTVTFATLGLSRHPLRSPISGRDIHHELVIVVKEPAAEGGIAGILQQVGVDALNSARPYLRGDVVGPRGPLLRGSPMTSLYVAIPVYFPDGFASCDEDGRSIVFAWLVPISSSEAAYVKDRGWDAFEDRLVECDPDLTDPFRPSLPL